MVSKNKRGYNCMFSVEVVGLLVGSFILSLRLGACGHSFSPSHSLFRLW